MARLRREANESLRESEERLQIALDTGKLGSWQLDFAMLHMDCTAWLVADDERHTGFRVYCFDTPINDGGVRMAILKVIEVLAQSEKSWEAAAQQAVQEAAKTVRGIKTIYIQEMEATVDNDRITYYRVNAKISFELEGH